MKKNRSEFDLISDFFSPLAKNTGSLKLLDDVALINVDKTKDLVVSTDMLISGVHFFSSDLPGEVAHSRLLGVVALPLRYSEIVPPLLLGQTGRKYPRYK